jgi:two-component system, chemotaxis family, chemotaxis protein CheY
VSTIFIVKGKRCVLVVDDSPTLRQNVVTFLTDEYDCPSVVDGQQALEYIQKNAVDAVVTDLHMPNMSGLELLRALRSSPATSKIPVLVMTTETGLAEVNECRRLGCAGYVLKPVEKAYLVAKLRKLFSTPTAVTG